MKQIVCQVISYLAISTMVIGFSHNGFDQYATCVTSAVHMDLPLTGKLEITTHLIIIATESPSLSPDGRGEGEISTTKLDQ